ncbi:PIN domain-containing protein [Frondihabitans cladoniiphilus]|uniref:PIN domain-containing protein n=1 Tax=Frondihabitans cladoniiphilus TaxID=715785 RepID=A0ABP8W1A0_9MICO
MAFPVFFDTCAVFGALLNDLFLRLADAGAFRPLWSAHVMEELERNLASRVNERAARSRVDAMRRAFPDALVSGYDDLIESMTCDVKDRHVLAAAVRSNAEVVVTFNLRDFPHSSTAPYELEVVHPDAFLLDQLDLFPSLVVSVLDDLASAYERPALTVDQVVNLLERQVPEFAVAVRDYL